MMSFPALPAWASPGIAKRRRSPVTMRPVVVTTPVLERLRSGWDYSTQVLLARFRRRLAAAVVIVVMSAVSPNCAAQNMTTVAGTGVAQRNVDAGPVARVAIGQPFGVEFGPDSMLYVTEVQNHRILRVNIATGQVKTVAGTGVKGYQGDGGPALAASLNEPYELRFDPQGAMYFVEMQNHIVRCVDRKTGVIRTIAGDGQAGFAGDGGPALRARFNRPHSIALDGRGGLLVADIGNHRIRRIDLKTGALETLAGNGEKKLPAGGQPLSGPLLGPRALFVKDAEVYVALREGHSVWKFHLDERKWVHVAGRGTPGYSGDGGDPRLAEFNGPKGVAVDDQGRVVVADTENQVIRRIDPKTQRIETLAGGGPQQRGYAGDGGPATAAWLARPHGVCIGPDHAVYIGDTENHRVRRVEADDREGSPR